MTFELPPVTPLDEPPPGFVERHACDLPDLTSGQTIGPFNKPAKCSGCGTWWVSQWKRDVGGDTQPGWITPPDDWTPPADPPPTDPPVPGDEEDPT